MKAFSFFIPAENFTYSFVLPSKTMNGAEFVNTAGLRHPDFLNLNSILNYRVFNMLNLTLNKC
jgi:hypothetical protein